MEGINLHRHTLKRSARKVVAIDTESNTTSTATLLRRFCSLSGMPSFRGAS